MKSVNFSLLEQNQPSLTAKAIRSVSAPLVLRVLGPVGVTGVTHSLSSQQLALITYLACVGPARRETLVDAVWGGRPISAARFANLLSQVRAGIGREHLPVSATNHYRLVGLPTDLDLLSALAADAQRGLSGCSHHPERSSEAEIAALEAALGLVRGPVFDVAGERSWWWLDGHPEVVAQAEAAVGQVANRLVALLWRRGDLDRARDVCGRALSWSPLDRDLIMALEGLHRAQGRPGAAHRLIERWRVQVERLTGEDPMPMARA